MKKVILVTGGARGIGRAIADELASDHHIALTYRSASDGAAAFQSQHPDALVIKADLAEMPAEVLLAQVLDHFGRIDGLVNNAGLIAENPLEEFDADLTRKIFDLNVIAPLALSAAAAKHMGPNGAIVNITSVNATNPPVTALAYGASKAALANVTKGLAKALGAQGIRVNAIAPGAVERSHAPRPGNVVDEINADSALGRQATLAEIATTPRFLLTSASSGITGETLTVSAGYRI